MTCVRGKVPGRGMMYAGRGEMSEVSHGYIGENWKCSGFQKRGRRKGLAR